MRAVACGARGQRGFSAVMVIALLVLLGGLSVYAVGLVTSVLGGHARELSYARAALAAQAGLDWGRWRISAGAAPLCAAVQTLSALPGSLRPYAVTVRCSASGPYTEGAATLRVYRIDASACNLPALGPCPSASTSADYVQASLTAQVER
jgi:MSHA biogenesis protein MshP